MLVLLLAVFLFLPALPVHGQETQMEVERQIYQYLTEEMQFNQAAACGILANIEHESGFHLTVVGDGGTSFGLCQWHDSRRSALIDFCASRGLDHETVEGQMAYLDYELKSRYHDLYMQLHTLENTAESAYIAGYLWCVRFERPADMEEKGASRGNLAQYKYWDRYSSFSGPSLFVSPNPPAFSSWERPTLEPKPELPVQEFGTIQTVVHQERATARTERKSSVNSARRTMIQSYHPRHLPETNPPSKAALGIALGLGFLVLGDGIVRTGPKLLNPKETAFPKIA